MKKIEIKLKECCLDCEHFDSSGCVGLNPTACYCGEYKRTIACGHMEVCKRYLEHKERQAIFLTEQEILDLCEYIDELSKLVDGRRKMMVDE